MNLEIQRLLAEAGSTGIRRKGSQLTSSGQYLEKKHALPSSDHHFFFHILMSNDYMKIWGWNVNDVLIKTMSQVNSFIDRKSVV